VSDWQVVWLGVAAISLAIMALVQLGVIVVCIRLAKELATTAADIRRDVRPLVEKAHRIADDAQRATSLALMQVERIEQLVSTTTAQVDQAVSILKNAMGGPIRQGYAFIMAVRAILSVFRSTGAADRGPRDEEDAMFVG
jgi:hypothetical protein